MVKINQEMCIGCGSCVKDCLFDNIYMENGKAAVRGGCIECGHCEAICPKDAVVMEGYEKEEVLEYDKESFSLSAENFLNFMKNRRSIRQYRKDQIEQEKLERVVEAGRFTPTARNSQDVHFVVVQDQLEELKALVYEGVENVVNHGGIPGYKELLQGILDVKNERGVDKLFFDAPALVVLTCPSPWNGTLAARSMELMAGAEGLGALYTGFIQTGIRANPKAQEFLGIEGETIAVCMLLGYPAVQYRRTVPRKKANVTWK